MTFPLPLPFLHFHPEPTAGQLEQARFLVGAMTTASHAHFGERLAQSCADLGIPVAICEVPEVHRSISLKGSDNPAYTKANFIHFLLDRYRKPVLYLDADCIVMQYPDRIEALLREQVDFAIFNWLAELDTAAFLPAKVTYKDAGGVRRVSKRFYKFSHSYDLYSDSQLICSGATQFYNDTPAARALLSEWHEVILNSPDSSDDECLDFAYNNRSEALRNMKVAWLEKSYIRIAWWIYTKPVINHPDIPASSHQSGLIDQVGARKRVYFEAARQQAVPRILPRDCLIDVENKLLFKIEGQRFNPKPFATFSVELWL